MVLRIQQRPRAWRCEAKPSVYDIGPIHIHSSIAYMFQYIDSYTRSLLRSAAHQQTSIVRKRQKCDDGCMHSFFMQNGRNDEFIQKKQRIIKGIINFPTTATITATKYDIVVLFLPSTYKWIFSNFLHISVIFFYLDPFACPRQRILLWHFPLRMAFEFQKWR